MTRAAVESYVGAHAMPSEREDLDRGDNYPQVKGHDDALRVRLPGRVVVADERAAFLEALRLRDGLLALGYAVAPGSRLCAATVTGPDQEVAGWRAHVELRLTRSSASDPTSRSSARPPA